ncbi:Ribosomal protein S18 acetylase RimI [Nannocystis exedens]|uniref:Ribosomal protein S18 acetylase RimI n=1 Tax=Nannocystis exedens TaxID=54 RepID=A0A1I2AY52_9BACT|nr:GNAT family N-acetyltransferase [Nannocystis exedens]PCC74352.1 Acetyltransferase (GNAT) family protein [Nannocystis exedens]SFE48884.1 Ribosomal protein S18 acetylase RimI [Nannocystis exedens]
MLVLSPATAHDLPALQEIERSATDLYYEAGFSPAAILPRGDADMRALLGQTTTLLARDGDDAIGYVSYYPRGPYMHLEEIAVRRDRQRRGSGRLLADQVLAAARDDPQCSHLSLVAFCRAGWALRLYDRLGFRPLAALPGPLPHAELLAELLPDPGAGEPRQVMVMPIAP